MYHEAKKKRKPMGINSFLEAPREPYRFAYSSFAFLKAVVCRMKRQPSYKRRTSVCQQRNYLLNSAFLFLTGVFQTSKVKVENAGHSAARTARRP